MPASTSCSHWLVKQEPTKYSWEQFQHDKTTIWDGVRNYQARNNLRAMKKGDAVLFYRSVEEPAVMGVCHVSRTAYPDPSATEGDWSAVDLKAAQTLPRPVPLATVKSTPSLADIALLRQSRLSVMPLTATEFKTLLKLGGLKS